LNLLDLINLIDNRFRARSEIHENAFEHLYWQAAGKDYQQEKNLILEEFERK
jgi:tryptophan 2,3-dioxygenase